MTQIDLQPIARALGKTERQVAELFYMALNRYAAEQANFAKFSFAEAERYRSLDHGKATAREISAKQSQALSSEMTILCGFLMGVINELPAPERETPAQHKMVFVQ